MPAETYIRASGAWRQATEIHVRASGAWRDCTEVYVRASGQWRLVFEKATVTLSGETITDTATDRSCTAGIRFNSDGTVDKLVNATYTQIDSGTDWIIPNGSASGDYDVRVTSVTGDAFTSSPVANGSWINLGSNRLWSITDSDSGASTQSTTFTAEIRNPSGTTVGSASYTLTADYEVPTTVTLSGQNVSDLGASRATEAGIIVKSDGYVYQLKNGVETQIDTSTDWIIPRTEAGTNYQFRVTGVTGDAFTTSPGSNGTWFAVTAGGLEWSLQVAVGDTKTTNFTLEVREGTGATLDTGAYQISGTDTNA